MSGDQDCIKILEKYIREELPESDREKVKKLIVSDPKIAGLYNTLKTLEDEKDASGWPQIRDSALNLSTRLFDDFRKKNLKNEVDYGVTVFDSKVLPLPDGGRPAIIDARRLKYIIGRIRLELSLYPVSAASYEIVGQMSGLTDCPAVRVVLKSNKATLTAIADQFHLFRFSRVPVRKYSLLIMNENKRIGLVKLDI